MVILFSTKCFLFVYMYIDLLKLKAYNLFENSDAELSLLLFLKKPTCLHVKEVSLLNLYHTIPSFNDPVEKPKSPLKTLWEKEKMLVTNIFSFSHKVYNSFTDIYHHFIRILQTFSVWKSLTFCCVVDWIVLYAAFNNISVISRRQLHC